MSPKSPDIIFKSDSFSGIFQSNGLLSTTLLFLLYLYLSVHFTLTFAFLSSFFGIYLLR
jgi:hypothetical protein